MNNSDLLHALHAIGYFLQYMPHPAFFKQRQVLGYILYVQYSAVGVGLGYSIAS